MALDLSCFPFGDPGMVPVGEFLDQRWKPTPCITEVDGLDGPLCRKKIVGWLRPGRCSEA